MEVESARRLKRHGLENLVFDVIVAAGTIAVAAIAPNTVSLLKHVDRDWAKKRDPRQRVAETLSKLKRRGFVEFSWVDGRRTIRLTEKGRGLLNKTDYKTAIKRPKKWDGRWRIIIFDIPEPKKSLRNRVRALLVELGFCKLQDSVWVHPFPCEELIVMLKTELHIGKHLLYIIADAIEFDKPLRSHFKLPAL